MTSTASCDLGRLRYPGNSWREFEYNVAEIDNVD